MQGLILAAGMGKRLKELTNNNTKCMGPAQKSLAAQMLHRPQTLSAFSSRQATGVNSPSVSRRMLPTVYSTGSRVRR